MRQAGRKQAGTFKFAARSGKEASPLNIISCMCIFLKLIFEEVIKCFLKLQEYDYIFFLSLQIMLKKGGH